MLADGAAATADAAASHATAAVAAAARTTPAFAAAAVAAAAHAAADAPRSLVDDRSDDAERDGCSPPPLAPPMRTLRSS